jgi:hypothetical protein
MNEARDGQGDSSTTFTTAGRHRGYVWVMRTVVIAVVLMLSVSAAGCGGKASSMPSKTTSTGHHKYPNKPAHY